MRNFNPFCLVFFSLVLFAACKKDADGGGSKYYMKAKVEGAEKNYSNYPMAVSLNVDGVIYSLGLSAGAATAPEGLSLQINKNSSPVTAGTYNVSNPGEYTIGGVYNPGTSAVAGIYGAGMLPSAHPLQIVITKISDTEVSGTFSGEYLDNSGAGTNSLLITDGSFNLPIQ